ncbi:MAG: hypothetical protein QOG89_1935, partial [Thermomicrobiales bacterium]|nr:hypothetical protein [Thermomicrobiales bacterium]
MGALGDRLPAQADLAGGGGEGEEFVGIWSGHG